MSEQIEFTNDEAIEAIRARINGEWDKPELIKLGALSTTLEDIERIIEATQRIQIAESWRPALEPEPKQKA